MPLVIDWVGVALGTAVLVTSGVAEGVRVGPVVGVLVGVADGPLVGTVVGVAVGASGLKAVQVPLVYHHSPVVRVRSAV